MLIFEIFEQVPDPRKPGHAIQHLFLDVLCIALCAMLSGAEGFEDMEDYGRAKEKWLREHLLRFSNEVIMVGAGLRARRGA